jgi:hypothetical protein
MASLIGFDSTSSGFDPGLQQPALTFGVWGDSGDADGVVGSSNIGSGSFQPDRDGDLRYLTLSDDSRTLSVDLS